MKFVDSLLKNPHLIAVVGLLMVLTGYLSFRSLPLNLFPDVNRPVVTVVTPWPGAAASDVATDVTHPVEVRLSAIDGVRRVTSASRDEVSSVSVEFEYGTNINDAATDVSNELPRVRGVLPSGVRDSLIFKITEAAHPVVVLAITTAEGVDINLEDVRRIAENPLRDAILGISGVAEAEVFGGHSRQLAVDIDRDKLEQHGLTIGQVAAALANANVSVPSGLVHSQGRRYLLTAESLAKVPEDVAEILIPLPGGSHVRAGDLARIDWGTEETSAMYRGNGKPAIALSLLRGEKGYAANVLNQVEKALPGIRAEFPMLKIQFADTQGRLIDLMVENMLGALRDAVVMTLVVLLLFLANTRAALITAVSLPMSYLLTFAGLKILGYEFDMVTLTAVIIAVGLLADDAVVVIENIERRMRENGETGLAAAAKGTGEILLADTAGTISTVIVLVPIMFLGGYVQNVLRPLTVTLSVALFASLIVSVTIIPILASRILKPGAWDPLDWILRPFTRFILEPLKLAYVWFVKVALNHRAAFLVGFAVIFVVSARQMKVLGRELMPRMDTGVSKITFEAEPDTDDAEMVRLTEEVEAVIYEEVAKDSLISVSTVVGSEPGVKSFGAARTLQQGEITLNLVDRFHRDKTIYVIEEAIRTRLRQIPGLISANVTEYGATPLSSVRGTIDVMVSGPDPEVLGDLSEGIKARLKTIGGLSGYSRTWQNDSKRIDLEVDPVSARLYGVTAGDVARQAGQMVGGMPGGRIRVSGENPIPVWLRLQKSQRRDDETIRALPIRTADGSLIPLNSVATLRRSSAPTVETHERLVPTIDVVGYRRDIAVTLLQERVNNALRDLPLPRGYSISQVGEIEEMDDAFNRMGKALVLGLVLLYLMLVVTFRSFLDPLAIMATLPLALIGAAWAMMLADKHGCLPSFMGLILLMGIVVNNGILIVDFAKVGLKNGKDLGDALTDAVSLRTRPILMTAGASAVGMIPVALERAVGLERLSPLAVVAIGGLITGTFLTLLVVPILFSILEGSRRRFGFGSGTAGE